MRSLHQDERAREECILGLNKIARHGVRKMLAEALEAEVQAYVEAARGEPNDEEHAPVHEKRLRYGARDPLWSWGCGSQSSQDQREASGRGQQQEEIRERDTVTLYAPLAEGHGGGSTTFDNTSG